MPRQTRMTNATVLSIQVLGSDPFCYSVWSDGSKVCDFEFLFPRAVKRVPTNVRGKDLMETKSKWEIGTAECRVQH
jgi:hypothetical protein